MAETRLIQKQLAGVEDLLLGIGTATQTRATGPKTITKINADRLQGALVVDTIDELLALNPTLLVKGTCIVKDENRGGVFVYQEANALVNNGGTIFNGWTRQYSGAVDVKWFGAISDFNQGTMTGTDNTDAFNRAIQSSGLFGGIVKFKGHYGVKSTVLIDKYGVSLQGSNTLQDSIEAFDWQSGDYIVDCTVVSSTTTGFSHSKFTINGNNQPVGNMRIVRPYDNCSLIDVNLYKTHNDYNSLRLGGANISQTFYMRNVLTMHNDITPTVPSVYMERLQECKFDLCKFWGAKYVGGSPYPGSVKSLHIKNCRSLQFDSLSVSSSMGIIIEAIGQDVRQITFRNTLFEDVNGFIETIGESSTNSVNEVLILNPRHESPVSGSYIFGAYTKYSSIKSNIYLVKLTMDALSSYNKAEILYSSTVTDSGTRNSIEYYPDGNTNLQRFNNTLAVSKHSTPSLRLEAVGRIDNDTGLVWDASSSVDNGLYIRKSGEIMTRYYNTTGGHRKADYANNVSVTETTPYGFIPTSNNTYPLGGASNRWSTVYAGTGTINTSDAREKTFLDIEEVELQVAKELKALVKKFKFNDAIEAKGVGNARIHYGTSAQEVIEVFKKYGLDAMQYAMVCYDEWDEELEVVDSEENIIQAYRPAGNRYGIRYEELIMFILGAM